MYKTKLLFFLSCLIVGTYASHVSAQQNNNRVTKHYFRLLSPALNMEGRIATRYTCEGENISPALSWQNEPANTKSLVLIMDDPDAPKGVWDHWLLFNIPASVHALPENLMSSHYQSGKNSLGKFNYSGPCPPDHEHHYYFKLYALDTNLTLSHPNKTELERAMQNHVLGVAILIGKYAKK